MIGTSDFAACTHSVALVLSTQGQTEADGDLVWYLLPRSLTDHLRMLPRANLLGQSVLIKGKRNVVALVTFAEAAYLQLRGFTELLECTLQALLTINFDKCTIAKVRCVL